MASDRSWVNRAGGRICLLRPFQLVGGRFLTPPVVHRQDDSIQPVRSRSGIPMTRLHRLQASSRRSARSSRTAVSSWSMEAMEGEAVAGWIPRDRGDGPPPEIKEVLPGALGDGRDDLAVLKPSPAGQAPSASPDGRWVASSGLCCGGRQQAIVVRALGDSSARCLAGPLRVAGDLSTAWSSDGQVLYFVSGSPADSTSHAYRIRRLKNDGWSGRERIDPFRHPAVSVSASRGGTIAVVVRQNSSLIGDL